MDVVGLAERFSVCWSRKEFAQAAGKPKAAMIAKTGAKVVTAECSACRMQINNSMNEADVDVVFKNPIELIAEALRQ